MSALALPSGPAEAPWTCPFCPLHCDTFGVDTAAVAWSLVGSDCPRAHAGLARFGSGRSTVPCRVDGDDCPPEVAIAVAAERLGTSRQPLFGGLGTDVAGARALYSLSCRTGAICDAAGGTALWHGLRALQDRGAFTTTLGEVRARADLIVCIGALPTEKYPEFLNRCGATARIVVLQPSGSAVATSCPPQVEFLPCEGDFFDTTSLLAAHVAGRVASDAAAPLKTLATRLLAARYAVLVYETSRLPAHGALVVEAILRTVSTLNRRTRAAALPLGGDDGASTVNAVFTWLSGLPTRTRLAPVGLEHEPVRFDARHLLADGAVDTLLWIASYGSEPAPPVVDLPRIVLGHPCFVDAVTGPRTVFIPVATPGIGAAGHLFRVDSSVMMPLRALHDDGLPAVSDVVARIGAALAGTPA